VERDTSLDVSRERVRHDDHGVHHRLDVDLHGLDTFGSCRPLNAPYVYEAGCRPDLCRV
jgi:hypothetical protein